MPRHDFKCSSTSCGMFFEVYQPINRVRAEEPCPKCGSQAVKVFLNFGTEGPSARVFKPAWFEHISNQPLYIESRAQLRRECEKHGCYSKLIEDGYNR